MQRLQSTATGDLLDRFAGAIAAGSVNVISLEAVRERSGERWPRKREQVAAFVERAFVRTVGASVLVAALNEVEFLSIQPNATRLEALGHSAAVLKETLTFFLGSLDPADLRMMQVNDYSDGELRVEPVDCARWMGATPQPPAERPEPPPAAAPPDAPSPPMDPLTWARAQSARILLKGVPEIAVSFSLHPIWNIAQEAVASYHMQPKVFLTSSMDRVEPSTAAAEQLAMIGAEQAARWVEDARQRGAVFALHVPVPFLGVASAAARSRLQRRLASLPPDARRLMVLDLTGVEEGVPHGRLVETVTSLTPFCRAVLVRAPSAAARLEPWRGCHIAGVTLDCHGFDPADPLSLKRLAAFVDEASKVSRTIVGYGLQGRSLTLAAWAAGFTHVTGDAVNPSTTPRAVRWSPADLYA